MSCGEDIEAVLCEFIEAIIHEVLHLRAIYPVELFARQRLYNMAVRKARHPKLNEYIHGVVQSIKVRASCRGAGEPSQAACCLLDHCDGIVQKNTVALLHRHSGAEAQQLDVLPSHCPPQIRCAPRHEAWAVMCRSHWRTAWSRRLLCSSSTAAAAW